MKKILLVGILLTALYNFSAWSQTSAKEMEEIAKKATPQEQYDIAHKFYNGDGVAKDEKLATKWILNAAKKGDVELQYTIAHDLLVGNNITKDPIQGEKLLEKAAKAGDASLKIKVGDDYLNGKGVAINYEKAEKYYKEAAKTSPQGYVKLGDMYTKAVNGKLQLDKAVKFYEKAGKNGDVLAYIKAGDVCLTQNKMVREQLAAKQSFYIHQSVWIGRDLVRVDDYNLFLPEAIKFYGKAFDAGSPEGVARAIKLLSTEKELNDKYGKSDKVRGGLEEWTIRLETFTDPTEAINLGDCYVTLGDFEMAIKKYNDALTSRAVESSIAYAKLAQAYEASMEFDKSLEYYQKGQNDGNQFCIDRLEAMKEEMPKGVNNFEEYLLIKNAQNYTKYICKDWLRNNFKNFDKELKYFVAYQYLTDFKDYGWWGCYPENDLDSYLFDYFPGLENYESDIHSRLRRMNTDMYGKMDIDTIKPENYDISIPLAYTYIAWNSLYGQMESRVKTVDEKMATLNKYKEFMQKTKDIVPASNLLERIKKRFGECNATRQIPLCIDNIGYERVMERINEGDSILLAKKEKTNKRIKEVNESFKSSDIDVWLRGTWLTPSGDTFCLSYGSCYPPFSPSQYYTYWVEGNTIYVQVSPTDILGRCKVRTYKINKAKKTIDDSFQKVSTDWHYDRYSE